MNVPFIVGIVFMMFGFYMMRFALRSYNVAIESQKWPSVNGELIRVELWGKRNIDGQMIDSEHLSIEYEYKVNEVIYTETPVSFYTLMCPETLNFVKSHPCNSNLPVYFDPNSPAKSVLIPGLRKEKPYSDLIIASLGVLVGAGVAVSSWLGVLNNMHNKSLVRTPTTLYSFYTAQLKR